MAVFQRTLESAPQLTGRFFSVDKPWPPGPRKRGQSSPFALRLSMAKPMRMTRQSDMGREESLKYAEKQSPIRPYVGSANYGLVPVDARIKRRRLMYEDPITKEARRRKSWMGVSVAAWNPHTRFADPVSPAWLYLIRTAVKKNSAGRFPR